MSRTEKWMYAYILMAIVFLCIALFVIFIIKPNQNSPVPILLALFILGRIPGHFWRDFYRGKKLFDKRHFIESEQYFARFLGYVKDHPRIKYLIWLSWGVYTRDIEAMTLNNIGCIHLETSDLEKSEYFLNQALEIDKKYPIPYFNLAVIAYIQGNTQLSNDLLKRSWELGFKDSSAEKVARKAGEILSTIEGSF